MKGRTVLLLLLIVSIATATCIPFDGTGFADSKPECYVKNFETPGRLMVWTDGVVVDSCVGEGTDLIGTVSGECEFHVDSDEFYTVNTFFAPVSYAQAEASCTVGESICIDGIELKCFSMDDGTVLVDGGECTACDSPCQLGSQRCFNGQTYRCQGGGCAEWVLMRSDCAGQKQGQEVTPGDIDEYNRGENSSSTNETKLPANEITPTPVPTPTPLPGHFSIKDIYYLAEEDKRIDTNDHVWLSIELLNNANNSIVKGLLSSPYSEIAVKGALLIGELKPGLCYYEEIPSGETKRQCWIQWPIPGPPLEIVTKDAKLDTPYILNYELTYVETPSQEWWDVIPNSIKFMQGEKKTENLQVPIEVTGCTLDEDCKVDAYCNVDGVCESSINGCFEVIKNGDPKDKLDILVIGAEYGDYRELKSEVLRLMEGFFSVEPFDEESDKFNVWMLKTDYPKINSTQDCDRECADSIDTDRANDFKKRCKNDNVIFLFRDFEFRSCAAGKYQWSSLSCQTEGQEYRLLLHEAGHSIGGLKDEYIEEEKGDESGWPNCAPDLKSAKEWWGDLEGVEGVGYYTGIDLDGTTKIDDVFNTGGCAYLKKNIRPTAHSIMKSHWELEHDFYPVNERAIRKELEDYT